MNNYDDYYTAIDEIKRFLWLDLIGPIQKDEVIENVEPLNYYAMGILWAKRLGTSKATDQSQLSLHITDEFAEMNELEEMKEVDELEEFEDPLQTDNDSIAETNLYKPSAMGISVMLPGGAKSLKVEFTFGKYKLCSAEKPASEVNKKPRMDNYYERKSYKLSTTFLVPNHCGSVNCKENERFHELGVDVSLCIRKIMSNGSKLVTVSVSNSHEAPQRSKEQNEGALFQCKLQLNLPEGFIPVYQNEGYGQNDEEQISAMQYRNVQNYAYGHGCSVMYDESQRITDVCSDFMPSEQVLQMMPGETKENLLLHLIYWNTADHTDACDRLLRFIGEYADWRIAQEAAAKSLGNYTIAAKAVLQRIDTCITRLKNGLSVLRSNKLAWSAFRLMNEAMLLQRAKTKGLQERELKTVVWYPFQLAYILQIIPDITEERSAFRETVDLLWFPTGGGKTEAYLGVAAFVIFYRRLLTKTVNDGVTIIMRYTLRLLTIQQFERASALICACEHLRKKNNISGGEINIGLWIGSGMTPNHIEGESGAAEILRKLKNDPNEKIYEGNPVQITTCPWCGSKIDLDGYEISKQNGLSIRCNNNPNCDFHKALPIYVVDDDIYRVCPTLVLSTIDKFARLAWESRSKSLFGDSNCAPPELIIQDELHLISGPLGSLAGIYEIGVEYLCSRNGRYPKVIASTATVKNAAEQIRNLYNKQMFQFPPSGVSYTDSFFAMKASKEERPARTYLGLCETGGSLTDLMIRVYANLIFIKRLFIKQGKSVSVIDQFSTIVGYFNAIKDLGGAGSILNDRIYAYIRTLVKLKFKKDVDQAELTLSDIKIGIHDELTSRKTSKEVKETLERLTLSYQKPGYYSYILASNMLSVGIDIDRLGVMTMYNQPKSNAEYIQASSRVGRRNPGLVLAMYNGSRSRDKSHYEQFGFYHKAFYQYVEATSVTPFSARAIEKALHCVFILMLRLSEPILAANDSAVRFRTTIKSIDQVIKFILDRIQVIRPESVEETKQYILAVVKRWQELAEENPDTLVYHSNKPGYCSLLVSGEQDSWLFFPATLNSLRNVEANSNIFIQERD